MKINKSTIIILVISGLVSLTVVILSLISLFSSDKKTQEPTSSPTPTTSAVSTPNPKLKSNPIHIQDSPEYKKGYQEINDRNAEVREKETSVGALLSKLPYQGLNFSMTYSYATDTFTITINSANQALGNAEFDQFLKNNNIYNRSWLEKYTINPEL